MIRRGSLVRAQPDPPSASKRWSGIDWAGPWVAKSRKRASGQARDRGAWQCYMNAMRAVERPSVTLSGGLAQLGEHLLCKQGVVGSIPSSSTKHQGGAAGRGATQRGGNHKRRFRQTAVSTSKRLPRGECFDVDIWSTNAAAASLLQRLFFKNS